MSDARAAFFLHEYVHVVQKSLAFFGAAIRRRLVPFGLIVLACTAAGGAYWYRTKPIYESELVCRYINQPMAKKTFGEMVQQLNGLAQTGSHRALAAQLGLSDKQAAAVLALEARNRSGSPLYEDITEEYQPIYITLKATDNTVFAPVQAALVQYLGGSAYQRTVAAAQVGRYTQKIGFLRTDLALADSLVAAFTTALRAGAVREDTGAIAHQFNVLQVLGYKGPLEEELINLERQRVLDSGAPLVVVHGFVPADHPSRGSKKIIAAFALIGVLGATGWAVLKADKDVAHA